MDNSKIQRSYRFEPKTVETIDTYKTEAGINNATAALEQLIELGYEAYHSDTMADAENSQDEPQGYETQNNEQLEQRIEDMKASYNLALETVSILKEQLSAKDEQLANAQRQLDQAQQLQAMQMQSHGIINGIRALFARPNKEN